MDNKATTAWMSREIVRLTEELRERRASLLDMQIGALVTCLFFAGWLWWNAGISLQTVFLFAIPQIAGVALNGMRRHQILRRITARRAADAG